MVVIYTSGHQNNAENTLLAVDFLIKQSVFNMSTAGRMDVRKPLSIQVMWSTWKACEVAQKYNYFPWGGAHLGYLLWELHQL